MDVMYEKGFINHFVKKNRRDRLWYELSNPRKRHDAFGRFCHNVLEIIDEKKIICSGKSIAVREFEEYIKKFAKGEKCYVISWDEDFDGKIVEPDIALEHMSSAGMCVVMIFSRLVIIKEEQGIGAPMEYVLYSEVDGKYE